MLLGRTVYESRKKLISQGSTPSSASSSSPAARQRHLPPLVPTHALVREEGAAGIRSIRLGLITLIDRRGASRWKHPAPSLSPARRRQRRREWVVVVLVVLGGGGRPLFSVADDTQKKVRVGGRGSSERGLNGRATLCRLQRDARKGGFSEPLKIFSFFHPPCHPEVLRREEEEEGGLKK